MKQVFKTVSVIALAAVSASCAKERIAAPSGEESVVSFTVSAPVFQTRAIADGNTVDKLACCVYDSEGNYIAGTDETPVSKTIEISGGNATFTARLVTGQTYSFIFWAYKAPGEGETSPYTFDTNNRTVSVSYADAASNDESRDAFYAYVAPVQIKGSFSQEVKLYRPFAQLNFGVEKDDIIAAAAANISVSKSKVKLTNLGNKLDLTTGAVTGEEEATFALATCPMSLESPEELEVSSTKYGYVAMNYVLVGKEAKSLTDATLWVADADGTLIKEDGLKVTNVPLQGNYRTNVLGNLFTSEVITSINVAPAFVDDIVKEFVSITAEKIKEANTLIEANKEADIIEVKFATAPEDNSSQAILTTPVKADGTLNVEVSGSVSGTLYVGDYANANYSADSPLQQAASANAATVNITIPEGVTIKKLVIDAGTKTVNINGINASEYSGTQIETLEATTSANTLIIAKGQAIDKLVFHQGGLEIHGTVKAVTIDKTGDIYVRECENISNDVYTVLKPYIVTGYVSIQNEDNSWNIVAPVKIGNVAYATLADAVKAAGSEETTINILYDIDIPSNVTIDGKKIILNTNGCNIKASDAKDTRALIVDNGGELTVIGGGKITRGGYTGDNAGILNLYSGKLTVGDVYLEGANTCIMVLSGSAVINDAKIKALDGGACVSCHDDGVVDIYGLKLYCDENDARGAGACWAESGGTIRIWDGTFDIVPLSVVENELEQKVNYCLYDYRDLDGVYNPIWGRKMSAGQVIVYGGRFKAFNPEENYAGNNAVAEGYQSVQDGDYWIVSKK